jgi:retinol dehydrogenase-12
LQIAKLFKVTIITGGYSGVGFELAKLLYQKNCTIYIAGRRAEQALKAIDVIKSTYPLSEGRLEFLPLDLADLATIKTSAAEFLSKEKRLDILWNNAGVLGAAKGSKSKQVCLWRFDSRLLTNLYLQGHDLFLATHCLGPFLFTRCLHPLLSSTVAAAPASSVRVLWVSSIVTEFPAAKNVMDLDNLNYKKKDESQANRYAISKTGNVFIGIEWAKRNSNTGITHLVCAPGVRVS